MAEKHIRSRDNRKPYHRTSDRKRQRSLMGWVGETMRGMFSAPLWVSEMFKAEEAGTNCSSTNVVGDAANPIDITGMPSSFFCKTRSFLGERSQSGVKPFRTPTLVNSVIFSLPVSSRIFLFKAQHVFTYLTYFSDFYRIQKRYNKTLIYHLSNFGCGPTIFR